MTVFGIPVAEAALVPGAIVFGALFAALIAVATSAWGIVAGGRRGEASEKQHQRRHEERMSAETNRHKEQLAAIHSWMTGQPPPQAGPDAGGSPAPPPCSQSKRGGTLPKP